MQKRLPRSGNPKATMNGMGIPTSRFDTAFTWPVLAGDEACSAVHAAIDVAVAQASSLTRDQYTHVFSTLGYTGYKDAPHLCLAAFDELQSNGVDKNTLYTMR
jgi:hypothetical protein